MPYDDIGRIWGNEGAKRTPVAAFDADARATLDLLAKHPKVAPGKLATMGFCIGGHLAWRAALQPDVKAAVCCYPTGVHNGKLGKDADAGTFARIRRDQGRDARSSSATSTRTSRRKAGRSSSTRSKSAGVKHRVLIVPGEHAFMRDEGPRYDPAAADQVWGGGDRDVQESIWRWQVSDEVIAARRPRWTLQLLPPV